VILNLLGTVRTVVVPPSINKTFWVTRDKASSEYLEQMGSFIAWLVLDVTPASIDWKKDILLGYVEPEQYGPLKTRQEVEAERLKRINASHRLRAPATGAQRRRPEVVIRGRLRTLVNGFETANDLKAYRVEFSYAGARMHLKSFKEVPNAATNQPIARARCPVPRRMGADPLPRPPRRLDGRARPCAAGRRGQRRRAGRSHPVDQGAHPHPHRGAPITDVFGNIHSSIAVRQCRRA
jgi:conjugal transfer pilus assembly protein TraE